MTSTASNPAVQAKSHGLFARLSILLLSAMLVATFGIAVGCLGGVLIGEGTAQRAHQQDLHQFLQLVIDSDPAYSELRTESGSGTQVFVVGSVPTDAVRQELESELQRRFGDRRGADFVGQVDVGGHSAP